jgi:hypothetical protein
VNLDTLMITAFCWIDDTLKATLKGKSLRQRGPTPTLSDAEVLTMEVVGESLSISQDQALYQYFRRHYTHFFQPWVGCIAPPLPGRRLTSGESRNWSGDDSWS